MITYYIGCLFICSGTVVLLPLFSLMVWPQESELFSSHVIPGVASILLGYLLTVITKNKRKSTALKELSRHQDSAVVIAGWIIAISVNALPFILSGTYTISQSFFESVSGWTTTGLSIVNVDIAPHIVLLHRSIILFFGGIGIVLSVLFFMNGRGVLSLYNAEGHSDMLAPDVRKSARYIVYIYTGYIATGVLLYCLCGMDFFDAFNHSIAAISTGGFSTHSASIGYYNSVSIEVVTEILMILGNTNFFIHLLFLTGKWKNVFLYCETKTISVILAIVIPIGAFIFYKCVFPFAGDIPSSIRASIFQTVSALTTTGFQTVEFFSALPSSLIFLLTILMLIGGGTGSTAGGIKQFRIYTLFHSLIWTIQDSFSNQNVVRAHKLRYQNRFITADKDERLNILSFILLYMICFFIGTAILTCYDYNIGDSMFEIASALGTVGLSTGIMTANSPNLILWTGSICMFLGRVEIYLFIYAAMRFLKDTKTVWERHKTHNFDKT